MILLLGGTSESLQIADGLTMRHLPFILSVTTDYGEELAEQHARYVSKKVLEPNLFKDFFDKHHIHLIIDATHPFARIISTNVIEAAVKNHIAYLRFERSNQLQESSYLKLVDSLAVVCEHLTPLRGIVYLSTGSKTVDQYVKNLGIQRLHIRALPTERVLKQLTMVGFEANQVDAIQGPFSTALNVELFRRVNAAFVVTKESGRRGGVQEKIKACEQLKIPCFVIKRPTIQYPKQVSTFDDLWREMEVS